MLSKNRLIIFISLFLVSSRNYDVPERADGLRLRSTPAQRPAKGVKGTSWWDERTPL